MGDWRDAANVEQGEAAYAVSEVVDDDAEKPVTWDVTTLVKEWAEETYPNQGIFLRVVEGKGPIVFASREHSNVALHGKLRLVGDNGSVTLAPSADTYLTRSTYRTQGESKELRVSGAREHLLIRFDLTGMQDIGQVSKATLILTTLRQYGSGKIGVFRCRQGDDGPPSAPTLGLAARYPFDRGIDVDEDVVFATSFESKEWQNEWSRAEPKQRIGTIGEDSGFRKFESFNGKALQALIAKGETTGLNTVYKFREKTEQEPEEVYFRYYLRLADDWNQTVQGGKLPGISGTYGRGGWGGRKSDGINGWSARGLFRMTIPDGNPLAGRTPVGFYCYHADMRGSYGTNWIWAKNYLGYLNINQWYAIEQYCRLNTPGKHNGVLRAWIDGQLAFEKNDVRFRLTGDLRIEQIWLNVYHGGTIPSPYDQHVFIDNVVIAKKYIGPVVRSSSD